MAIARFQTRRSGCARARLVAPVLLALAGCTGDTRYIDVRAQDRDGAVVDGAVVDGALTGDGAAHVLPDGALADGRVPDGALDEDAGVDPDALDPTVSCEVALEDDGFEQSVTFADDSGFSLSVGQTGFGVAFQSQGECTGGVSTLRVSSLGSFLQPDEVVSGCVTLKEVAVLAEQARFRLAFIDNSTGSAEVHTLLLDGQLDPKAGETRARLTTNGLRERRPVLADLGGVPTLAFIAEDLETGKRRIASRRIVDGAEATDLLSEDAGHKPMSLALAQLGPEQAAVAWVNEELERGVWLQPLDAAGEKLGAAVLMSDLASSGTSVDMATRIEDGGAVIYSVAVGNVNREVRFRRLDQSGKYNGSDIKIVGSPLQGRDASIARLGGGYVVVYRALPVAGTLIEKPEIRMTFVTKEGKVSRDRAGRMISYHVADSASEGGGRVTARVSNEGAVLVGFVDSDASGKKLRLVRKRLDCAL